LAPLERRSRSLPVLQERVNIRQALYSHETGSKANYLQILQGLVETQQELAVQKSHADEAEAALAAITEHERKLMQNIVTAYPAIWRRRNARLLAWVKISSRLNREPGYSS
jgi:transcription termination factor NusB